ncbi:HAD family hydrolase [Schaalia naturae]|uniref:HAD family hydrolase n=1 Tax=Schaalia naturae TaxID=635203 RepID=A0ABW2SKX2_9ACTO
MNPSRGGGRAAPPGALLVDQDGTTADTEPIWMAAETDLAGRHGATWTPEMAREMVGRSLLGSARLLIDHAGLPMAPEQTVEALLDFVGGAIRRDGVPWLPGIRELLARMHVRGVPCALVTSTYSRVAREVVEASRSLPGGGFDLLVAGEDVAHPKPAPDAYLMAAARLGADIGDCLVLEDSPSGVAAGLASGAHVIAIPCVVPVEARPGLSRLRSAEELTDEVVFRVMSGEAVDTVGP